MNRARNIAPIAIVCVLLAPNVTFGQSTCPKIDVHQHAHPLNVFRQDPTQSLPILCVNDRVPCDNPPSRYTTDEAVLRGTLDFMRQHNIVKAFVSSGRDEVRRWVQAAPSRFVGGISFDPTNQTRVWPAGGSTPPLDVLRAALQRGEYGLVGELGTQYGGHPPTHPALTPYFALAAGLDVPVLIHALGIGARAPTFRVAAGSPLLLEDVLKRHQTLRLYVENAGYPFGDEMIAMLYMYPQLYADLSTITWLIPREAFHDYLRRFVRAGFGDRLMFGSDQMVWPETIAMAVDAIESADFLSADQKCDIFFNNAIRFFRLDADALRKAAWR